MVLGIIGYTGFLLKLRFFMQPWYYVEILILCAISLDGILTANWPALRPWGLMRISFLVMMMILNAKPAWAEAHTRRSNLDLAAAFLSQNASPNDLIVVQNAWEGITFNRYYRGQAQWLKRTSDQFARGTSQRSDNGENEPTRSDDSGVTCDS